MKLLALILLLGCSKPTQIVYFKHPHHTSKYPEGKMRGRHGKLRSSHFIPIRGNYHSDDLVDAYNRLFIHRQVIKY